MYLYYKEIVIALTVASQHRFKEDSVVARGVQPKSPNLKVKGEGSSPS